MMSLSVFLCTVLSTVAADIAIHEKWRIRRQWTQLHRDTLSGSQQDMTIADGANLVMGPIIFGMQALVCLIFFWSIIELIRFGLSQKDNLNVQVDVVLSP